MKKALLLLLIPVSVVLCSCSGHKIKDGNVIDKSYTPYKSDTTPITNIGPNGMITTTYIDSSTPERYEITIEKMVPERETYLVSAEEYEKVSIGEYVRMEPETNEK